MAMRFHHMNAYTENIGDGLELFVSYATNVAACDVRANTIYIGRCFDVSRTTAKQLCRWISEKTGFPVSIVDVRRAFNEAVENETADMNGVTVRIADDYEAPINRYFGFGGGYIW